MSDHVRHRHAENSLRHVAEVSRSVRTRRMFRGDVPGPGGCSAGRRQTEEHQRCRSRSFLSSPCAVGVPTKLAVTSKRNVVKMTMSVIVGFVVCWTPYFVVSLIRIYSDYRYRLTTALSVSELMALGHSAINPLLYIVFSTRAVRAAFLQLRQRALPRCCLPRRGRGHGRTALQRPWIVIPNSRIAALQDSSIPGFGDSALLGSNIEGFQQSRITAFQQATIPTYQDSSILTFQD